MGLAVSQIRLLALTRRKSDIELDVQINSKRKQALTRKSTELSQTYYQKLQQTKIQYATSDGYENVDYNYIMGKTTGGSYDDQFLKEVMFGSGSIAKKTCNSMILTDKKGKVILNDQLTKIVTAAAVLYDGKTTEEKTAEAIKALINQKSSSAEKGLNVVNKTLNDLERSCNGKSTSIITKMLKNGGYMEGGSLYIVDGTEADNPPTYVSTSDKAKDRTKVTAADVITPQDGYNYDVKRSNGSIFNELTASCMYDKESGGFIQNTGRQQMQYLGNLVSYLGPMISSALQNGTSSEATISGVKKSEFGASFNGNVERYAGNDTKYTGSGQMDSFVESKLAAAGQWGIFTNKDGAQEVWICTRTSSSKIVKKVTDISSIEFEDNIQHNEFAAASDTKKLQDGFRSGTFQLCMVDNMAKGRYHKNTTLEFFIQMSYVSDKIDFSLKEEITAWYQAEQAKISEQETYWDEEITNLSTELNSVNAEITSVKTLKSNAIKSVFEWGSGS